MMPMFLGGKRHFRKVRLLTQMMRDLDKCFAANKPPKAKKQPDSDEDWETESEEEL